MSSHSSACFLSIVSPVYRAEGCLHELYRRLRNIGEQITPDFELVLVEDCGPDGSWEILEELAGKDTRVKAIRLSRNFGQHCAITAGLDVASGEWVVVMDCDLQDPPEAIPQLLAKAREGHDVVFARRIARKDHWAKTLSGCVFYRVLSLLTGEPYDAAVANFSISSRKAITAFRQYREIDRSFPMIMRRIGFDHATVDVPHAPRYTGSSSYTWRKLLAFAMQNVLASSTRPLAISVQFGACVALASLGFAIYVLTRYLLHSIAVPGWASLALLTSFLFGLLFVQLGVIGLYLGRTFEQSKQRPLYHIDHARNISPSGRVFETGP